MIIKVKDRIYCVIVPQKSGISTVTNILAYNVTNSIDTKTRSRRFLKRNQLLYHVGSTLEEELNFVKENNIKLDYLYGVVRNPLDRFISSYKDRILKKGHDRLTDTSLDFAINNLHRMISKNTDFGKHSRLQTYWLGNNPKIYDRVFDTYELNTLFKPLIETYIEKDIPIVRENVSDDNIVVTPTALQEQSIKLFYKPDYDFLTSL